MARRIDIDDLYRSARERLRLIYFDGAPPTGVPERCPFVLTDFIPRQQDEFPDLDALLARLAAG